ncbi:MAG: fibronectin type III-like domain-contianing protein [Actinoallomurus sp.]
MGYRWYDATGSQPQFPFGFGLSYTSFSISKLVVGPRTLDGTKPIRVSFFVQNTGDKAGAEVPQVYLGLPASAGEPPKRLVGFDKVWLNPGERKRIEITIDPAASNHLLAVWDTVGKQWKTADGRYQVYVGNSSENLTLHDSITVRAQTAHLR